MVDDETDALPDGTDTVIAGASKVDDGATLAMEDTGVSIGSNNSRTSRTGALGERLRSGREQMAGQAGEKARGLVAQGLERSAEAFEHAVGRTGDKTVIVVSRS